MKRTLTLIACVAICCAMTVSCKNGKKSQEPTQEEVLAAKQALADSVLAEIDAVINDYFEASANSIDFGLMSLTEAEKLVKPDYLLDPKEANNFVAKSQKASALGIYIVDYSIRRMYDMPMEETKEAIAKLAAELNHPLDENDFSNFDMTVSEKIKKEYAECKERGDMAYFWQFHNAAVIETGYIISQNPELFFKKVSEEQWKMFRNRIDILNEALAKLAQYDEETAQLWGLMRSHRTTSNDEERSSINQSVESAKQHRIGNKDKYIARRNALLK